MQEARTSSPYLYLPDTDDHRYTRSSELDVKVYNNGSTLFPSYLIFSRLTAKKEKILDAREFIIIL